MIIRTFFRSTIPALLFVIIQPASANTVLEESVSLVEQWVNTELKITEAISQWGVDKASMESLVELYKQEIESLEEKINNADESLSAAETRRSELIEQETAIKAIEESITESIITYEAKIINLMNVLPPPLKQEIQPLFNALPDDPRKSKLSIGQRIQPIIGILTQIQKFNQAITVVEDFREFEQGRTVQMETIYFGLGVAYFVDQSNTNAGYGMPTESGWKWTSDNSLALNVRGFLDIYKGSKQAEYVKLPVQMQK